MSALEGTLLAGRYRIDRTIGSGGMSFVYEAEDLRLSRRVAIKVLKASEPTLAERLFREAKAAARADHPAIVAVFGYGTDPVSQCDYLVMERLQGENLVARIAREGTLPVELVVKIAREIADALEHVHAIGVVHRDLKPANVFLARKGLRIDEVKLLDFGVAKHLDLQTLTVSGEIVGTVAYMAPEQLHDPKNVDGRVDIYALGVLMYECLTGRLPFQGGTITDLAQQILHGEAEELARLRTDLDPTLTRLVARCMQPRPSDRPANARVLRDALLQLVV